MPALPARAVPDVQNTCFSLLACRFSRDGVLQDGLTALQCIASLREIREPHMKAAAMLLNAGAHVNANAKVCDWALPFFFRSDAMRFSQSKPTALAFASSLGHTALVALLLKSGADPSKAAAKVGSVRKKKI
jgi:hypothetical protein